MIEAEVVCVGDDIYVYPLIEGGSGYMDYLRSTGEQGEYIIIDSTGQYSVEVTSYSGCGTRPVDTNCHSDESASGGGGRTH